MVAVSVTAPPYVDGDALVATLSVGMFAFSSRTTVCETPPPTAVSVTGWGVVTAETVVMKPALVALAGIITLEGTDAAALLLDRLTANPEDGADAFSVSAQASVPEPVVETLVHES